jgi:branched-chain amino acid transport system substrate-binding protein
MSSAARRLTVALMVGGTLAFAAGCGGSDSGASGGGAANGDKASSGGDPYVIGAPVDITGAYSSTSEPKLEGLQLYAKWINSKGGIDGHPLKIDVRDNQSNPSQAATNARAFLNDSNVTAAFFSSVSATLAPYLQAAKDLPTLYGNVCYPPSTPSKPSPTFFCVGSSVLTDALVFPEVLEQLAAKKGMDKSSLKVGIVSEDIPGCRYMNGTVIANDLKKRGMQVVGTEIVPASITDMDSVAGKLMSKGANAIVHYCLVSQMLSLGESLKRKGFDGIYLITAQHETTTTGMERTKYPNEYALQSFSLPDDSPAWADIKEAYDQFKPKLALVDMRFGWANGMVLDKALRECGFPCERSKLTEILNNNFTMDDEKFTDLFFGPLKWTSSNHTTDVKQFQFTHWDTKSKAMVPVFDQPLSRESLPMETQ